MKFEDNQKIEELLNAYIDDELSTEESVQIQRLVRENSEIAVQLRKLERCKMLVSSLPPAEPPAKVVAGVKELIRSRSKGNVISEVERRQGARHLFIRQAIAASIIFGAVGIMGGVIYKIVGPEKNESPIAAIEPVSPIKSDISSSQNTELLETAAVENAGGVGLYSLQLQTADFGAVDAYINKMLEESPWLKYQSIKDQPGKSAYRILCSRGGLEAMMSDLAGVWSKFDSAKFVVHTDNIGQNIAIDSVRPAQISDIAKQNTIDSRVKLAKNFAALNSVRQIMPDEKTLAFTDRWLAELTTIPKPALTSGDKNTIAVPKGANDKIQVNLNIIVTGQK